MSARNGKKLLEKRKCRRHPAMSAEQARFTASNLSQAQIQEVRALFNFLDEDRDGVISEPGLRSVLVSLGQEPSAKEVATAMLDEVKGTADFSRFVSLFASMMSGTGDSDESVRSAFTCLDEDRDGIIGLDDVRELLTTTGLRLTDEQVDEVFVQGVGTDKEGCFNYEDVLRLLKYGESKITRATT